MVRCVAVGCKSSSTRASPLQGKPSFFRFPKNPVFLEAWVRAVGRKNWSPSCHSYLCSDHFTKDQYINLPSGLRKREGAIPTIFQDISAQSKSSTKLGKKREQTPKMRKGTKIVDKLESKPDVNKVHVPQSSPQPEPVNEKMEPGSCFVPYCPAKGCHKFNVPKDAELRKKWESIIGRMDGRVMTEDDVVCEMHFLKPMIKISYIKTEKDVFLAVKTLVDDALPVVLHGVTKANKSADTSKASPMSSPSPSTSSAGTTKTRPSSSPLPSTSSQGAKKSTKKVKTPIKRKCCVPNCPSFETPKITFHPFPAQKGRRKTWLNLLNMEGFNTTGLARVCCKHFTSSSFSKAGELRPDATPKLYSLTKKMKQEPDSDSQLSEAQKTAAWLQSVKQKREEKEKKRLLEGPVMSRKRIKFPNPWGVKRCDVVISEKERKLADKALSECDYDPISWLKNLNVPMPMVVVKEEDPEVMDLTIDDPMDTVPLPPSPVTPLVTDLTTPKPIQPKPSAPPVVIPPVITSNNLMFQTTLRSASEVKSVQDQPLPPSTIYRVIIPTSVQGHTIEPNSILQQLKDKITAMHQENVIKNLASSKVQSPAVSTPPKTIAATISQPKNTPLTSKNVLPSSTTSTQNILKTALGQTSVVKPSKLTIVDNESCTTSSAGDHDYASPPSTTSWPILIQNQLKSVLPTPADIRLVASTSSSSETPSQSNPVTIGTQKHPVLAPSKSTQNHSAPVSSISTHKLVPILSSPPPLVPASSISTQKVLPAAPKDSIQEPQAPVPSNSTQIQSSISTHKLVPTSPPPLRLFQMPALNNQSGMMMQIVNENPGDVECRGTSYVAVPVPGGKPTSYMAVKSLSIGTQTTLAINATLNQDKAVRALKANEENKKKLKKLRQGMRRLQDRLTKTTTELEDLKSMKAVFVDTEKGQDNVIIVETADKCTCYHQRREHEDLGNLLKYAVQKKIPPPAESKALVAENEKLIKRIELIKRRLHKKEILKVVVLKTEDILPVL